MEPRVLRVERVFPNSFLQGRDYMWFQYVFNSLVEEMKLRICGCFVDSQATFILNREMYRLFYSVAPMNRGPYWDGIYIREDPWDQDEKSDGRILLEYREPVYIPFELTERRNTMPPRSFTPIEFCFAIPKYHPEIEKVIFNNPATIVLWNDGTKTVVQCQKGDDYDPEKGLAMAIAKKALGNTSRKLNDVLHKWEKKEEPSVPHSCSNCKYVDQKLSKKPCNSCDKSFGNWEADK